jgi:hypothetical protein
MQREKPIFCLFVYQLKERKGITNRTLLRNNLKNLVQNVILTAETACTVEPKQALDPVYFPVLDKAVKKVLTAYVVVQVLFFEP